MVMGRVNKNKANDHIEQRKEGEKRGQPTHHIVKDGEQPQMFGVLSHS
jgi:hypothetical protein